MKKHLFIFLLILQHIGMYAQPSESIIKNYTPSPEAYSLMEYSEIPVSLYTGVPDISIPVYTIRVGDYKLPISLSYHASGIKVAQEASRIGLGWSLHAGGSISRSICGKDDFKGFWIQTDTVPNEDDTSAPNQVFNNSKDYEPDIFHYNFAGYSGKFYINKGAGQLNPAQKFFLANPEDNLRIDYQGDDLSGGFIVITPENVKYIFNVCEYRKSYSMIYTEDDPFGSPHKTSAYEPNYFDSSSLVITSWLLTRIDYPTGDTIDLEYELLLHTYLSPIFETLKHIDILTADRFDAGISIQEFKGMEPKSTTTISMETTSEEPVLKRISWKDGFLEFVSGNDKRIDIRTPKGKTVIPKRLEKIQLYSRTKATSNRTYTLHHSYFQGRGGNGVVGNITEEQKYLTYRLKLDSISIQGTGSAIQKYRMEYDMSDALPMKNNYSCDKWGYYNGYNSWSDEFPFVPFVANKNYYHYKRIDQGDNFEVTQNLSRICLKEGETRSYGPKNIRESTSMAGTWMLTSLVSPLEGRTDFKYEPNQVWSQYEYEWQVEDSASIITLVKGYEESEKSITFEIPFDGYIDLICTYDGSGHSYEKEENICLVKMTTPRYSQIGLPKGLTNTGSDTHGQYTFTKRLVCFEGLNSTITAKTKEWGMLTIQIKIYKAQWKNREPYVGGVRIAEIKSPLSTRTFEYRDSRGISSGELNRQIPYSTIRINNVFLAYYNIAIGNYQFIEYNSTAVRPLENPYTNYFMGYSEVSVIKKDKGAKIRETSSFYNLKEPPLTYYNEPNKVIPLNGKLIAHRIYTNDILIQEKRYEYEARPIYRIKALQVNDWEQQYGYYLEGYHVPLLSSYNSRHATISGKQISLHESISYEYNSQNYLVNKTTATQIGQPTQEHVVNYSIDYPNYNDGVFQANNIIAAPIEESFYTEGVLIKRLQHIHYKDSYIKPWKEYVHYNKEGYSSPPEFTGDVHQNLGVPEVVYTAYGASGQKVSLQTRQGQSVVLIWGYRGQHIIAQITGSSLDEVQQQSIYPDAIAARAEPTAADWELLHKLRSKLPRAQVVVTQYEPLVGIISQTDARGVTYRYTYDEFSRLNEVIETGEQEYILRKNEYKYATEK